MNLSEMLSPGDKIDMKLTYQVLQQQNGELVTVNEYKSVVMDFPSDHQIEIGMPTLKGKMILFQVGIRCDLVFYTQKGLFSCECTVNNRYKKDNFYLLLMDVNTPLVKYQRREYFRVECSEEFDFYPISEKVAHLPTTEALFVEIQDPQYYGKKNAARTKDISGGGVRFSSGVQVEKDEYILICIRLTNEIMDDTFYIVSQVISCEKTELVPEVYEIRAKFLFKDLKDREAIVRFVFEEERKIRRIKKGN